MEIDERYVIRDMIMIRCILLKSYVIQHLRDSDWEYRRTIERWCQNRESCCSVTHQQHLTINRIRRSNPLRTIPIRSSNSSILKSNIFQRQFGGCLSLRNTSPIIDFESIILVGIRNWVLAELVGGIMISNDRDDMKITEVYTISPTLYRIIILSATSVVDSCESYPNTRDTFEMDS